MNVTNCNQQTGVTSQRWGLYSGDVVAVPVVRHWSVSPTLTAARLPIRATSTDASFYPQFGGRLTSGGVAKLTWTTDVFRAGCEHCVN